MSLMHSGNMVPEITMEEHNGLINAKKVDVIQSVNSSVTVLNGAVTVAQGSLWTTRLSDASTNIIGSVAHNGDTHLLTDSKDITTSGTLDSLNDTVEMNVHGIGSIIVLVGGTWTGKIVFEGTIDSTWVNLSMVQPLGGITQNGIQNHNQNGSYRVLISAGYSKVRARMSEYTSGSATIAINGTDLVATNYVWQLNQENLKGTMYQGNPTYLNMTAYQGASVWSSLVTVLNSQTTITAYGSKGPLQQDTQTWAINTIDYAHHEVHSGSHFYVKDWVDIPSSATVSFLFKTPDTTKWAHAQWQLASEAEATFTLYEDATVAANGSPVTIYNNNRNSSTQPGVLAFSTPSITTLGNKIYSAKLGSGRAIGGGVGREHEMISKQNTNYLMVMANDDGTATRWLGYDFYWYEHTDKV